MIQKIKSIASFGVFKGFVWDSCVLDPEGKVQEFKKLNIFYGRNYSGKTSLSRIFRAMETQKLPEKIENPDFCISFDDNTEVTQGSLANDKAVVRVFNEDFVRENLRFVNNPEDGVEPFAVLGEKNNTLEAEIKALEAKMGSSEEGKQTGLHAELQKLREQYEEAKVQHEHATSSLEKTLQNKATNKENGIKYNVERFGDQNYNVAKLKNDIELVLEETYHPLSDDERTAYEQLTREHSLPDVPAFHAPQLHLASFIERAGRLVECPVGDSERISELARDAALNRWVDAGRPYHRNRKTCAFCGNPISENRWALLEKHFDEASERLKQDISALIDEIRSEKIRIEVGPRVTKEAFYSTYHSKFEEVMQRIECARNGYVNVLNQLEGQLEERKNDFLNVHTFDKPDDVSGELNGAWQAYETLRCESNQYTAQLTSDRQKAQKALRLDEVFRFQSEINYKQQEQNIRNCENKRNEFSAKVSDYEGKIRGIKERIQAKQRELSDETNGAERVNQYLTAFFNAQHISLQAMKASSETGENIVRFDVFRDGKKAYHLSEGEVRLLAFCYFLAKLDNPETHGVKPIIWIDDPISSLDGNHIFFIFSLIRAQIVASKRFDQLFISTHSLEFLKYLKKLVPETEKKKGKDGCKEEELTGFFLIVRRGKTSVVERMPTYMKKYVTEFNYLFQQIYKCATIDNPTDHDYGFFYNFGNNVRKFLEIYLYYKYPNHKMADMKRLKCFFDGDEIPAFLVNRIDNEYSHLAAAFERGEMPIDIPEMSKAAKQILDKLKAHDPEQYRALLESIGETEQPNQGS